MHTGEEYTAMLLGATGNVGGCILNLLVERPLCRNVLVVTRRDVREEVRKIEITYPTAFASAARSGGARVLAMMTAAGANAQSSTKYLRNMGEKEKRAEALRFHFLGLYRPGVILGNSNTPSALGFVMPLLHWAMPSRYHSIHRNDLARAMVAQSEQAFLALVQGRNAAAPAVKILEYKEMEPFFVAGDRDAT